MLNKLTDAEIKKALECCLTDKLNDCGRCPMVEYTQPYLKCRNKLFERALDLINRQEEEIEMLNKQMVFEINSAFDRGIAVSYIDATPPKALIESLTADNTPPTDVTEFPSASFYFELEQQRERAERFKQQWIAKIKAEAYKEFWQEAKQKGMHPEDIPDEFAIPRSFFDKVYEELVGELNG